MTAAAAYRDDGPVATAIARLTARAGRRAAGAGALLGLVVVVVLLAWPAHALSLGAAIGLTAAAVVLLAVGTGDHGERLSWATPAILRVAELGGVLKLTAVAAPGAADACYALLVVLAFHHYDAVYRLRHQGAGPGGWVLRLGGGWDGRLLAACAAAAAGVLAPALWIAAAVLGAAYVTDTVAAWARFSRADRPAGVDDDDELEAA